MLTLPCGRNICTYINDRKDNPNVELKKFGLYAAQGVAAGEQLFLKYSYATNF